MQLNERQAGHIEGYAAALQDIQARLTGGNWCAKRYDPATVEIDEGRIASYAYQLLNGSRIHPLSAFESMEQVTGLMLDEVFEEVREFLQLSEAA